MACIVLSLEAVKSVNSESIDIFGPKNQEEKPKEMTRTKVSAKGWRQKVEFDRPGERSPERGHIFELPK